MSEREAREEHPNREQRERVFERQRKVATAREEYLLRRQRKEILAECRRVAVVGASTDPNSESYVAAEKLLGFGLEVIPVLSDCKSYLGLPCYPAVKDIPGELDIVQVYPGGEVDLLRAAREAVEKKVKGFWLEQGSAGAEVKKILANGRVQVIEHESLEKEYIKHFPFSSPEGYLRRPEGRSTRVAERMSRNPVTVKPNEPIQDAIDKMKKGHFRHLPVVDDEGKLIGILSDRDIRLIRPSLAFVSPEEAALQICSTSVRQAAAFDPVTIYPEALLEQAAELMLRWEIGALPVMNESGFLVGIITTTDLLRGFVAGEKR